MTSISIESRYAFDEWCRDKPVEWVRMINLRSALRTLPNLISEGKSELDHFALVSFRAVFLATAAAEYGAGIQILLRSAKASVNALDTADIKFANENIAARNSLNSSANAAEAIYKIEVAPIVLSRDLDLDHTKMQSWLAISDDCDWLESNNEFEPVIHRLLERQLWTVRPYTNWKENCDVLARSLLAIDPTYAVWIDWYERRIRGERAAFDIPGDVDRKEDKAIQRKLAEQTDEDFWSKGATSVNTTLQGWIDEARARCLPPALQTKPKTRGQIAEALQAQSSPQAAIVNDKLDAVPNTIFDKPQYSENLANLPSEVMAFAKVILDSLPRNCEPLVRNCFTGHRDELLVRGNRPILNILKGMAASLSAELYVDADPNISPDEWQLRDPREWGAGMGAMFAQFFKGHLDLINHFPLDQEREYLIHATPIDEVAASGEALTKPVEDVAALIIELGKQGFATNNIVRIIEAHRLYNRDISQLPVPTEPSDAVTPKRRHVLQTAGFYLNTYSVIGSTASIYALQTVPAVQALLPKLQTAIEVLTGFIR